jgi:hypothetical protein
MSSTTYPIGFPIKYTEWKGKTFIQIVSSIQKNKNNASTLSMTQLLKPLPLKIYRRESHNINGQSYPNVCSRSSLKIFNYETPGNNIVTDTQSVSLYSNGIRANVEDITPTTISSENGSCNTMSDCFSPQSNARKRVRSSGMIPKKFNLNRNNDQYSTSTQQYLVSRNRTIKQNEFTHIRKGTSGLIPGPGLAASNIYAPGGLSHCNRPSISIANNNNVFTYTWVDGTDYTVTIPDGLYDVDSLNQIFKTIQIFNKTYYITSNNSKYFLLNIGYNTNSRSISLYSGVTSKDDVLFNSYTTPLGATWDISGLPQSNPSPTTTGVLGATYYIILESNDFSNMIGFAPGNYFGGIILSSFQPEIVPKYVALYYKPNNPNYGVQGAVDSSTRLNRVKYETINTSAGTIRSAYGDAAANALAYGVSEVAYTEKTQVGDKVIYTPVIDPNTGKICKRQFIYRG